MLFAVLMLLVPVVLADDYADPELLGSGQVPDDFEQTNEVRVKRGLVIHPNKWSNNLWPGARVPYEIASHYDATERAIILSAMEEFHKKSCIRFVPKVSTDRYYLIIKKYYPTESCYSYIGRQTSSYLFGVSGGKVETRMRLAPRCLSSNGKGIVMHELMHILGFYHEHQREDRDQRVSGSAHYNFKLYPRSKTYYMGAYDIDSIMHYNFRNLYRSRSDFSVADVQYINRLYKCAANTDSIMTSWEDKKLETNEIFKRRRL